MVYNKALFRAAYFRRKKTNSEKLVSRQLLEECKHFENSTILKQ